VLVTIRYVPPIYPSNSDQSSWLNSVHQKLGLVPVELGARHWQYSSHALEDAVLQAFFQDFFHRVLVGGLRVLDCFHDVGTVCRGDWDWTEIFAKVKLDVSFLEVMVVDIDMAVDLVVLGVDNPLGLPLAAPARFKLEVNAADIDLEVSILVKAETGSRRPVAVMHCYVLVNCTLNAILIGLPLFVKLLWEVGLGSMHGRDESGWVEHELDAELGIEVHEWGGDTVLVFEVVLSSDLGNHGESTIWKLDVLLVHLEVLLERGLDLFALDNFLVDDVEHILQNQVDLADR